MGDQPIYLPQQKTRRGVAGYRGDNVIVVDAKGHPEEAPANKTKNTRGGGNSRIVGAPARNSR
jgi:hypothetical protein